MIDDIDEDLAARWFNVRHMDIVITKFHDGKNSFVYREPKLNTIDKCSKQFSSSSNAKQSAMENYIMLGMNRIVVNLLQNTVDPVITVDDGNLDMVFNSYITDNCFDNPFTNLIDIGRHQNFNMTTGNNYIPRNSVLYVSSQDGLTEGEFAYDSVNNYSGADLVSKIIGRATRTTEINAAYQDFYKSMRGWASSDPTLTCLLAREVAGNFEFSQSPRLGVMLAVLHHYVMCNEEADKRATDLEERHCDTHIPNAAGAVADNNIVTLTDIQNLAGGFTALNGTVRFVPTIPPNPPDVWRGILKSFTTAPRDIPLLWFATLTPEIVKLVITLAKGGKNRHVTSD